jgi:hypothetical protein
LTVIEDTGGWIFGGFTPTHWVDSGVSETSIITSDPTRHSLLFSLRNPWGTGPMKFPLLHARSALCCHRTYGPSFGRLCDLLVSDNCNQNSISYTKIGQDYDNPTGRDGATFFTGALRFCVKEILVFQLRAQGNVTFASGAATSANGNTDSARAGTSIPISLIDNAHCADLVLTTEVRFVAMNVTGEHLDSLFLNCNALDVESSVFFAKGFSFRSRI